MNILNSHRKKVYFENLKIDFSQTLVLLDIDGTLVNDGDVSLSAPVLSKLDEIKRNNIVKICSNKRDEKRREKFEKLTGIEYLDSSYKKPNKKIASLFSSGGRSVIVIGDKFLTDGLLATRISARFIKVERKSNGKESLLIRFSYMIDNTASFFLKKFIYPQKE